MRPAAIIRLSVCLFICLILLGSAGFALGVLALFRTKESPIDLRLPVQRVVAQTEYVPIERELTLGSGNASSILGSWSQFRGDNRDAISTETITLQKNWSDDNPPPTRWGLPLGEGYAGFAVRHGRVYIMDYDMENDRDALRCLSLDDGQEIWRVSYPVAIKKNHGMSRTIPAVTDQYCVSIGPKCHVLCVDAVTGKEKWFKDLKYEYQTAEPDWYAGQCPIITVLPNREKPAVIIAPVGPEALMVALDCETGEELWRTPNPFKWTMTHSSISPMMLDDQLTFVYFGGEGLVGVSAEDGNILWSTPTGWRPGMASCPSPVMLPDNRIFCCGGYLTGSVIVQIVPDSSGGTYKAEKLVQLPHTVFDSEQQTPIYYDGHIFGLRQSDKRFVCLDLQGRIVWESGRTERFGSGPYIVADGMLLILEDNGKLTGCEATSSGYRKLFESQIMEDTACWAPMALVQGHLLLRDQFSMKCIDLRE